MNATDSSFAPADLLQIYRYLVVGREMAQAFGRSRADWHSVEGEEAVVVGSFYAARPSDVLSPHYRGCEIVSYMRGDSIHRIFASILGKATGISHGRHKNEFCGSFKLNIIGLYSGVLGPNICYGAGAALAMKLQARDDVSVISFGDGTANRGEFHETLRTCAMLKLPAVFVCQNNQYAISMSASRAFNDASLEHFGAAYGMPAQQVDGMDVLAVHAAVSRAVARARAGEGPTLIEALACRLTGHWVSDREQYRPAGEVAAARERDPIEHMKRHLLAAKLATTQQLAEIDRTSQSEVAEGIEAAQQDAVPTPQHLGLDAVYAH